MKSSRFVLVALLVSLSLSPHAADAKDSVAEWAAARVRTALLEPLNARHRTFSRAKPVPREQRVQVTASTQDQRGKKFVPFVVETRAGDEWRPDHPVGCVYQGSGDIFVRLGDEYYPASYLLGKDAEPVRGVCEAAATS